MPLFKPRPPRPPERKDSRAARLIALTTGGRPQWTPRDYGALASEGFAKNPVAYRCVRMIAEAAAPRRWRCSSAASGPTTIRCNACSTGPIPNRAGPI
jgi:phage portal protein BeeE